MRDRSSPLLLQAAPFLRRGFGLPRLMSEVLLGLLPVVAASVWIFGLAALLVIASATAGAVAAELLWDQQRPRGRSLRDGSALLTGVILALTLPPGIPLWMAFLGGVVAIGLGKAAFGGLGQNLFNPALVGRAFLQAAFPSALTTWVPPTETMLAVRGNNLALPLLRGPVDAVGTATPLGRMKFEQLGTDLWDLLLGTTGGSLGETCGLLILICGVVMALRRLFDWRIPVAILLSVTVLSGLLWLAWPGDYPSPPFMLFSGGLLFGTVYMATDPVTSPLTARGAWLFGGGVGALVVLIRLWGGLPEGVMYAILLMNATTPLIDSISQPRGFGRGAAS